jgi:hypothetical protein
MQAIEREDRAAEREMRKNKDGKRGKTSIIYVKITVPVNLDNCLI